MHLGKAVPGILRPDFSTSSFVYQRLPRMFVFQVQEATGTGVAGWDDLVTESFIWEISPDLHTVHYLIENDAMPGTRWELEFRIVELPTSGPPFSNQGMICRVSYWIGATEQAWRDNSVPSSTGTLQAKYENFKWGNNSLPANWNRLVPTAQFGNVGYMMGSAGWERQPDYHPYRTRP